MYEGVVQDLIDELGRLPGVGPKSAQRIAFHLLQSDAQDVQRLVHTLSEVKDKVTFCETCGNVAEGVQCRICADPRRDPTAICVVEEPKDVVAIERTREFRGRYHVLGGAISPMDGVGPDDLRFTELMARLSDGAVSEVIIATDPNLEGEATASYAARLLTPFDLRVTRLASGLPVGGDLEYADETTLLADECATEARAWLSTVADIASGAAPESAIPLLLLTTSQIQLVGARLGAISDVVLEQRFEDDPGPDTELDPLRVALAHLLDGVDDYTDVVDPVTSLETASGALSDDLAVIASALAHGLAHHESGRPTEALWWWQYSYLADWGDRAAMAVRVLQTLLAHLRLDADPEVVGEAEFDALHP